MWSAPRQRHGGQRLQFHGHGGRPVQQHGHGLRGYDPLHQQRSGGEPPGQRHADQWRGRVQRPAEDGGQPDGDGHRHRERLDRRQQQRGERGGRGGLALRGQRPASATAGSACNFTVTAEDPYNNTAAGYAGTIHFTSSDAAATLPANATLTGGTGTFSATLKTAGSQTLTAADTVSATIAGTGSAVHVNPAAATHFLVSAAATATAGSPFTFHVTAEDPYNNTATAYAGLVHFSSSDAAATLPGYATLTAGVGTFSATLKTAGSQTLTAADSANGSIAGSSGAVNVRRRRPRTSWSVAPANATVGAACGFTVTAHDPYGNTATSYAGTVHFASSDGAAILPANTTLTAGAGTFSGTFKTAGSQTVTATDTAAGSIVGVSGAVRVSLPATHFVVSVPSGAVAGSAFTITVTAEDQNNNTAAGYAGTIHFTSSDAAAVLPANASLTNGVGTFSITLKTAGSQTVTAADTVNGSLAGTSGTLRVSAAAATHFVLSTPSSLGDVAGSAFTFTVTAEDPYGNTATGYAGTVHFTSSDAAAALPANAALTGGSGHVQRHAEDGGQPDRDGRRQRERLARRHQRGDHRQRGGGRALRGQLPGQRHGGHAFSFTVTAEDPYNNVATGYAGTVHFTSSDPAASLPANATLTNGAGTFSVTLKTAGSQTVTATDTASSSLAGASSAVRVSAAAATHLHGQRACQRYGRQRLPIHGHGGRPLRQHRHGLHGHGPLYQQRRRRRSCRPTPR